MPDAYGRRNPQGVDCNYSGCTDRPPTLPRLSTLQEWTSREPSTDNLTGVRNLSVKRLANHHIANSLLRKSIYLRGGL